MRSRNDDTIVVKPVRGVMETLNFIHHLKNTLRIPSPAMWPCCILSVLSSNGYPNSKSNDRFMLVKAKASRELICFLCELYLAIRLNETVNVNKF